MAICLKPQVIWAPITNVSTPRYQFTVFVPDTVTAIENCQYVVITGDQIPPPVFVDNAQDAVSISTAFIMLIVTAGLFRFLRKMIEDSDIPTSDEKH